MNNFNDNIRPSLSPVSNDERTNDTANARVRELRVNVVRINVNALLLERANGTGSVNDKGEIERRELRVVLERMDDERNVTIAGNEENERREGEIECRELRVLLERIDERTIAIRRRENESGIAERRELRVLERLNDKRVTAAVVVANNENTVAEQRRELRVILERVEMNVSMELRVNLERFDDPEIIRRQILRGERRLIVNVECINPNVRNGQAISEIEYEVPPRRRPRLSVVDDVISDDNNLIHNENDNIRSRNWLPENRDMIQVFGNYTEFGDRRPRVLDLSQMRRQLNGEGNNRNDGDINNDNVDRNIIENVGEPHRFLIEDVEPAAPVRHHADIPRPRTYRLAFRDAMVNEHNLGPFRNFCGWCGAYFFESEVNKRTKIPTACCQKGEVVLPALEPCPAILYSLLTDEGIRAQSFRADIRTINSLFAMATFKATIPDQVNPEGVSGIWCFTVSGQIYHHCQAIPAIDPATADIQDQQVLKNAQYYFVDAADAVARRVGFVGDRVAPETLHEIEGMLRQVNPLVQGYMTAAEVIREKVAAQGPDVVRNLVIGFRQGMRQQQRNFNLPQCESEIAGIFEGDPPFDVDLVVYSRNRIQGEDGRHELKNLNPLSDPMTYPLLFPHGELGYQMRELHRANNPQKVITMREFYRHRLQCRVLFSILHNAGKLFQQYIVDAWIKVEATYLWYLSRNVIQTRFATYTRILEYLNRRREGIPNSRVGRVRILPASFHDGFRHQNRKYLDAMNIVALHGKPDLFITMTCNPAWPEITRNLQNRQKYQNRPDLICRVFNAKLKEFIDDIVLKQVYGTVLNYFYVIEFQARGLPHAHILVTFRPEDKLNDVDKVDQIISAEIPDPEAEGPNTQRLYEIVRNNYIHKSCAHGTENARCFRNNRCSKGFPKEFRDETELNYHLTSTRDGRPEYRRPNNDRVIIDDNGRQYDNRHIVPYNRYAALKYNCHINFEGVGSYASIKYLFKYVTKGEDMCSMNLSEEEGVTYLNWDEVTRFVDCRYVSATEAAWRLLELKLSDRSHSVLCLPIHDERGDEAAFNEDEDENELLARLDNRRTKLDAYFLLNRRDAFARTLKYTEVPEHYTWSDNEKMWQRRVQRSSVIGAMVEVTPANRELYYLRSLLKHVRGATSFTVLRTLPNGTVCATFEQACMGRHLFLDANLYRDTLAEAAQSSRPERLRRFYALIILISIDVGEGILAQVLNLWHEFKDPHMVHDFTRRGDSMRVALRRALNDIQRILLQNRDDCYLDQLGLIDNEAAPADELLTPPPSPGHQPPDAQDDYTVEQQRILDLNGQIYRAEFLNRDQRLVYDRVVYSVLKNKNLLDNADIVDHFEIIEFLLDQNYLGHERDTIFFVDGPAGTGKTFLYNVLINKFSTQKALHGLNILAVAYTGIAASLLYGGRTAHRAFRLPLDLSHEVRCGWAYEHERSRELAQVDLILWDEISMASRYALDSVDMYMRDITNNDAIPFGKKTLLLGGDFRQTLPIIKRASKSLILSTCVKVSRLWEHIDEHFKLQTNLRALNSAAPDLAIAYATWILNVGQNLEPFVHVGNIVNPPVDLIRLPIDCIVNTRRELIEWVYGVISNDDDLHDRVILSPTNEVVNQINMEILEKIDGESTSYHSVDTLVSGGDDTFFVTDDMLHNVTASNLPPHELTLKLGAVVMLLRNVDIPGGMCNGCRFIVRHLGTHLIELESISGVNRGNRFWLPKMLLQSNVPELARPIRRVQFPIRLAFAMTINKAQGQTFGKIGLHLSQACFSHGQLYVALSRVGTYDHIKISVVGGPTQGRFAFPRHVGTVLSRNVVYSEVLLDRLPDQFHRAPVIIRQPTRNVVRPPPVPIPPMNLPPVVAAAVIPPPPDPLIHPINDAGDNSEFLPDDPVTDQLLMSINLPDHDERRNVVNDVRRPLYSDQPSTHHGPVEKPVFLDWFARPRVTYDSDTPESNKNDAEQDEIIIVPPSPTPSPAPSLP